jgi:hypothetical protein
MTYGSNYATFCCFTTVAAAGFFLFGGKEAMWCYIVGALCLLPLIGVVIYACCVYPCQEKSICCYAEEGCWIYCCGYEEAAPVKPPKTKTKPRSTGNPKPSAPPAESQQGEQLPPIVELRQVVIQT